MPPILLFFLSGQLLQFLSYEGEILVIPSDLNHWEGNVYHFPNHPVKTIYLDTAVTGFGYLIQLTLNNI